MSEVLFYHLEHQRLEQVLPLLLEKTLERGWRAVIKASSRERVEALSASLWTWRDDAFLPHGSARDANAALQPIWLSDNDEVPNKATVRFCVDGANATDMDKMQRTIFLFDGSNETAVQQARDQWKKLKDSDLEITYWRQNAQGQWEKKA